MVTSQNKMFICTNSYFRLSDKELTCVYANSVLGFKQCFSVHVSNRKLFIASFCCKGGKREFTWIHSESLSNKKFENPLEIFAATKTRNHCAVKCASLDLGVTSFVYNAAQFTCRCYDNTIDTSIYQSEPGSYFYDPTTSTTKTRAYFMNSIHQ